MNMEYRPDPRAAWPLHPETEQWQYDVVIRVAVDDVALLWRRAAAHLLSVGGLDEAGLDETIGPREDPAIADCLSVLLGPMPGLGIRYELFAVRSVQGRRNLPYALCGG